MMNLFFKAIIPQNHQPIHTHFLSKKESVNGINGNKSKAVSKVLQLMDQDYSYSQAIKIVLNENKKLSKKKLEKELNKYI